MTENHIDSCSRFNFLNLKENMARPRKKVKLGKLWAAYKMKRGLIDLKI